MSNRAYGFLLPLIVVPIVVLSVIGIGSLLLAVGEDNAIPVALVLTFGGTIICAVLSARSPKHEPEQH